ncbi:hypothetical protein KGY77_10875 [Candidatus Bipolaricaulota bacterium]|nr:hypothetical protein [Candidatus Bipolaricaulota bacterium]
MSSNDKIDYKFAELTRVLNDGLSRMKAEAHGGNSVLLVYPPDREEDYLNKAKEEYSGEGYSFVNCARVLTDQVDELGGIDALVNEIEVVGELPKRYFKEPFVERIRDEIVSTVERGSVPVLIRLGVLVGIVSLNRILEDSRVLSLNEQIVVLYPGIYRDGGGQLYFLNEQREASSYRAKIIPS